MHVFLAVVHRFQWRRCITAEGDASDSVELTAMSVVYGKYDSMDSWLSRLWLRVCVLFGHLQLNHSDRLTIKIREHRDWWCLCGVVASVSVHLSVSFRAYCALMFCCIVLLHFQRIRCSFGCWLRTPYSCFIYCTEWSVYVKYRPLPSNRHHWSSGDRLEGKGENYQVCSVQYCVQQLCTVRCTHIWTD